MGSDTSQPELNVWILYKQIRDQTKVADVLINLIFDYSCTFWLTQHHCVKKQHLSAKSQSENKSANTRQRKASIDKFFNYKMQINNKKSTVSVQGSLRKSASGNGTQIITRVPPATARHNIYTSIVMKHSEIVYYRIGIFQDCFIDLNLNSFEFLKCIRSQKIGVPTVHHFKNANGTFTVCLETERIQNSVHTPSYEGLFNLCPEVEVTSKIQLLRFDLDFRS